LRVSKSLKHFPFPLSIPQAHFPSYSGFIQSFSLEIRLQRQQHEIRSFTNLKNCKKYFIFRNLTKRSILNIMEHLPYELRVHITTFLEPPDIRALCMTGKSFSRLGSDENLFCKLYHRDFIPHIRAHTETDTRNMLAITNSELHERVKESLITRATRSKIFGTKKNRKKRGLYTNETFT
jgi:hypothetical protein